MKAKDPDSIELYDFPLPRSLIAQAPAPRRDGSRLLYLSCGHDGPQLRHLRFRQIATLLHEGDLLVLNDTKVVPARIFGRKPTGGKVELLLERLVGRAERKGNVTIQDALVLLKASRRPRPDTVFELEGGAKARLLERSEGFYLVRFETRLPLLEHLERYGHTPLPPYIKPSDSPEDERRHRRRYQTVYADKPGAVAAPTAGLHFTAGLLERIRSSGVRVERITLHVGAGTFLPVKSRSLSEHRMHSERFFVPDGLPPAIGRTRRRGGRVVAVGTTVVRALEAAALAGWQRGWQETDLFIRPGHRFAAVDALVTNFHLPRSTLVVLVSAFAGRENIMAAYREAIRQGYRFFSYGDAMFIEPERSHQG